ncbi:MAG: hypothetical protein GY804_08715 [Alphaproteobacteria bacterium]|nr:hypothetical protein [Alphaproteobacteria bacterium]
MSASTWNGLMNKTIWRISKTCNDYLAGDGVTTPAGHFVPYTNQKHSWTYIKDKLIPKLDRIYMSDSPDIKEWTQVMEEINELFEESFGELHESYQLALKK